MLQMQLSVMFLYLVKLKLINKVVFSQSKIYHNCVNNLDLFCCVCVIYVKIPKASRDHSNEEGI